MTSWQDPQDRGAPRPSAQDPTTGQPTSRRAAREAERRAAEALQERQPHPSGVVDFDPYASGPGFAPDQDFHVGDTQDIWAALTRGEGRPGTQYTGTAPQAPIEPQRPVEGSAVSGELLDRVRDAVLRRGQEPPVPPAYEDPTATRRARRMREAEDVRDDGLPAELFTAQPYPPAPVEPQPYADPIGYAQPAYPATADPHAYAQPYAGAPEQAQPQGFQGYDYEDDGYYDEPYAPEPTIAIPSLRPMELDAQSSTTNPVSLPQSFAEPAGDDALTFSSPVPVLPADPYEGHRAPAADPAFQEPPEPWDAAPQAYPPSPKPAQANQPFYDPQQAAYPESRLGPPSDVTDLAGFEALIRKARQQPAAQPESRPALAWADEDEDVQEGFTGLLSRSVQGSHGSTNALILPNDPQPDLAQAVSGTGDIFITGSMNLPRSLSTTGTTSEHDSRDIDRLFEASQDEPAAGIVPVRASRAISGDAENRVLVGARRGRGNVLPTVLAIVAGVMAVGVVGLLVASWASNLF